MSSLALIRFIPTRMNIPFVKWRWGAFVLSVALVVFSMGDFFVQGLNFGIDFRGGTLVEMSTADESEADIAAIRGVAESLGLGDVSVQRFGALDTVLVRMELLDAETAARLAAEAGEAPAATEEGDAYDLEQGQQLASRALQEGLEEANLGMEIDRTEYVGPGISDELIFKGVLAVAVALVLMLVYIWSRFARQYSIGAVLALTHDVVATIGMFALTQMEFNISTIAAILTIVGYSMNDTVIVYDRIRENLRKYKKMPLKEVINLSINDTLSRTILTSGTTLLALFSLAILGGPALQGFAVAMIWGVAVGTYSSIFVAAPLLLITGVDRDTASED